LGAHYLSYMQIVTNVTNMNWTPALSKFHLCKFRLPGATQFGFRVAWRSRKRKKCFHIELKIAVKHMVPFLTFKMYGLCATFKMCKLIGFYNSIWLVLPLRVLLTVFWCMFQCWMDKNSNCGTHLWLGQFHLYLDQFSQTIVNLVMKNVNCACGTYYNCNCNCGTKITCSSIGIVQLAPRLVFRRDAESTHRIIISFPQPLILMFLMFLTLKSICYNVTYMCSSVYILASNFQEIMNL
jgi:hypothetical protein